MDSNVSPTAIKQLSHAAEINTSSTGLKDISQHPSFGAAFSLASLDQPNSRSSLSCMNLNVNFDTGVFLKSGSFDCLNQMLNGGSQFFKDGNGQPIDVKNLASLPIPNLIQHQQQLQQSSAPSPASLPIAQTNLSTSPLNLKSMIPASIPSNVIATSVPTTNITPSSTIPQQQQLMPYGNNALIQPRESEKRLAERKDDNSKFVDVTPFLTLPQHEAAKKLGIPSSTLAKRWKEASCNRKWPYRTVSKLDKEILTLLKNVENAKAELSPSVEATLGLLLKKRQEELKTVLVRL